MKKQKNLKAVICIKSHSKTQNRMLLIKKAGRNKELRDKIRCANDLRVYIKKGTIHYITEINNYSTYVVIDEIFKYQVWNVDKFNKYYSDDAKLLRKHKLEVLKNKFGD